MPNPDEQIVNEVVLEGSDKVKTDLKEIGDAGEQAFQRIASSASDLGKVGGAASDTIAAITENKSGVEAAAGAFDSLDKSSSDVTNTLGKLQPVAEASTSVWKQFTSAFGSSFRSSFKEATSDIDKVSESSKKASNSSKAFAESLKVLNSVSGQGEGGGLGKLARTAQTLGKAFTVAAPAIVGITLERIAQAGATAASNFADLAASLRLTTAEFSTFQGLGTSAGLSVDKFAASLKGVANLTKTTASSQKQSASAAKSYADSIDSAQESLDGTARSLDRLQTSQRELSLSLATGEISLAQYTKQQRTLNQQNADLERQFAAQDEALRKQERAHQLASIEALNNQTALEKLGIAATDSTGKLKKTPEVLAEISDAMKSVGPGAQRTEIEFDLIAAGLDRKLLPMLRQGSAEFAKFEATSKEINPGFDDKQIETADRFLAVVTQLSEAWNALIDELGVAVAPAIMPTLEGLRDLFVEIRPGVVEFGKAIAETLGPAFAALVGLVRDTVVPVFRAFFSALDSVAGILNSVFGSNINGMDVFVALIGALAVAFGSVLTATTAIAIGIAFMVSKLNEAGVSFSSVASLATNAWDAIKAGGGAVVQFLSDSWTSFTTLLSDIWGGITGFIQQQWDTITGAASNVASSIAGFFDSTANSIKSAFASVRDFILDVWNSVASIVGLLFGAGGGESAGGAQFASGGLIRGPGGPRGDKIPIWGSDQEYMVNAKATKHYGVAFMDAINSMRFKLPKFADGGLVRATAMPSFSPRMAFADGGLVSSGSSGASGTPINLTIDGQTFNLTASDSETADRIVRFATTRRSRSAGKKPSYYGG